MLLMSLTAFSQNTQTAVVTTHIEYGTASSSERDYLMEVNTYLHDVLEANGCRIASIENEDRVSSNLLTARNYRDAGIQVKDGEPIDFLLTIWLERQGGEYKVYSKRITSVNTGFKAGKPVSKKESLIQYQEIRELVALEILEQYLTFTPGNGTRLKNRKNDEKQIENDINGARTQRQREIEAEISKDRLLTWCAPSLIHIQNGKITSGALLLSGELLSVGGGIFTYVKANSLVKTLKDDDWGRKRNDGTAMSDAERAALENQYQTCQIANYVCWGTAAVLYAVNVATSYKIISDKRYVIVPSVQQNSIGDFAFGATLTYSF